MPSSEKKPSRVPMWRGIQAAYIVVALCLFPIAIGGYWAYGNKVNLVFYFISISTFVRIINQMTLIIIAIYFDGLIRYQKVEECCQQYTTSTGATPHNQSWD